MTLKKKKKKDYVLVSVQSVFLKVGAAAPTLRDASDFGPLGYFTRRQEENAYLSLAMQDL